MKKILAGILTAVLLLALVSCAGAEEEKDYGEKYPESLMFDSIWVAEDGDWLAECDAEDDGFRIMITHRQDGGIKTVWEYSAVFSGESMTLNTTPFGLKYTVNENASDGEEGAAATEYEDGSAMFLLDEEGRLIWQDGKEDAGKGLAFLKIGRYLNTQWIRGNREVIIWEWYDGEYDIRVYDTTDEENETVRDGILKGTYNPEDDTVIASGVIGDDGENINVTLSFNQEGQLVWTDEDGTEAVEFEADDSSRG